MPQAHPHTARICLDIKIAVLKRKKCAARLQIIGCLLRIGRNNIKGDSPHMQPKFKRIYWDKDMLSGWRMPGAGYIELQRMGTTNLDLVKGSKHQCHVLTNLNHVYWKCT